MNASRRFRTDAPRALALGALASLSLVLAACRAPGHKLNEVASAPETRSTIQGIQVTLRPLDAKAIQAQVPPRDSDRDVMDLLVGRTPQYAVGVQDILMVTVWDHPELTLPLGQMRSDIATGFAVEEDGAFYYPHVGRLKVAGLSVPEIRERLTAALAKVLRNPQVDVKVLAYRSQKVFVGGEVKAPGTHPINDIPLTLAEAVNRAGGFLPSADTSRVVLARGEQRWTLSFLDLITQGNRIGKLLLKDGDTLHVPSREENPVYVLGELQRPGSVPLRNGRMSLAQALSESGGISTASGDARSVYVLRHGGGDNRVEVFHLDARHPAAMVLADRFALQPRDLVYVDAGSLVRWNRVLNLLLPTMNALTGTASNVKFLGK